MIVCDNVDFLEFGSIIGLLEDDKCFCWGRLIIGYDILIRYE